MKLVPLNPTEVRRLWDQLSIPIRKVRAKTGQPWILEDVYAAIHANEAWLYTDIEDGIPVAVAVFKRFTQFGRNILFMWVVYQGRTDCTIMDYKDQIKEIARNSGCDVVQFESPRRGFERVVPELKVSNIQYEMEV